MRENIEKNELKNEIKSPKIRVEKIREKMSVQFCIQGRRGILTSFLVIVD
jgi:hypothetical protein